MNFPTNSFRDTIRVSNSLDPDQYRQFVGPDLGRNCLQRLLSPLARNELKLIFVPYLPVLSAHAFPASEFWF